MTRTTLFAFALLALVAASPASAGEVDILSVVQSPARTFKVVVACDGCPAKVVVEIAPGGRWLASPAPPDRVTWEPAEGSTGSNTLSVENTRIQNTLPALVFAMGGRDVELEPISRPNAPTHRFDAESTTHCAILGAGQGCAWDPCRGCPLDASGSCPAVGCGGCRFQGPDPGFLDDWCEPVGVGSCRLKHPSCP